MHLFWCQEPEKRDKKALKNWFGPLLAIIWQKKEFYGPKPNKILSKYSKPSYFFIVEVVKHFVYGLGCMSDYGQNSKNSRNGLRLASIPKLKNI